MIAITIVTAVSIWSRKVCQWLAISDIPVGPPGWASRRCHLRRRSVAGWPLRPEAKFMGRHASASCGSPAETVRQRPWRSAQARGDRHSVSRSVRPAGCTELATTSHGRGRALQHEDSLGWRQCDTRRRPHLG